MTSLRDEAQNPETSSERLHELINLPGNRGDGDSDAGWCREYVAANPNPALMTLQELAADQDDFLARLNAVGGASGIPAQVSAAVLNLTVTEPRSYGFLTAYASGSPLPTGSNLNFNANQTVPNLVNVPVGPDSRFTIYNRSSGSSQLVADLAGYFLR